MTTIAGIGTKVEVARALQPGPDGRIEVWDGKQIVRLRPVTPITWVKHPTESRWRGQREAVV